MPQIRAFFHNKKAATVFDSRCASKIALLAVVLLLSAYHGCTNNSAAAYEQNGKPQGRAAVVAGLRILNIIRRLGGIVRLGRSGRFGCLLTFFDSLSRYCRATGRIKGYGIVFISLL